MLPSEEAFAAAVSALGIRNEDGVVVYDCKGIYSAARVWWWVIGVTPIINDCTCVVNLFVCTLGLHLLKRKPSILD